jgi:hypothetical protein
MEVGGLKAFLAFVSKERTSAGDGIAIAHSIACNV